MSDKRKLVFDSGNRGLWLSSIVKYRTLCNTLVTKGDAVKTRDLGFEFGGTLVYYKINLNHYEESDQTLDSLDFDYL